MFRGNVVEMGEVEKVLMDPKHPLYRAAARVDPGSPIRSAGGPRRWSWPRANSEEYLRIGCKFAGALSARHGEVPGGEMPQDIDVDGVLVKCFLYD